MSDLVRLTASEIAAGVLARRFSAVEVAEAHLARIEAAEPLIDAFLLVSGERALASARRVDEAVARKDTLPLAGVPVAVKDVLAVEGLETTCGSKILAGYRPPYTATAVDRLERAGAVVLGKTNMDEFAMGSSTENSAYKKTRNPWDRERVPGGSSGGSAAAVAARMAPLALGTDTGGSIRQPAALCGVVGLKPTYGRVSRYGLVAFASSLDQVGPLTRSVRDAAIASSVLFGKDPKDATTFDAKPLDEGPKGLKGLRVGVPWSFLETGVDEGVKRTFKEAIAALKALGLQIVDVALPHASHAIATYYLVATAEASSNLARFDGVRYGHRASDYAGLKEMYGASRDEGFGPEVKRRIILGTFVLSSGYYDAYYLRAQKVRTLIRQDFEKAFEVCDVVATPTSPTPAFRLGEKTMDPLQMYLADIFTVPASLAGIPGISVPCGFADKLPLGLQLLGRSFDESMLFKVGEAYEAAAGHDLTPPN